MTRHIGEDAALYALGLLSDAEVAAVEQHIAHCHACAQLLRQASEDVTAMELSGAQAAVPTELYGRLQAIAAPAIAPVSWRARRQSFFAAAAAVLILALTPALYLWSENRAMHATIVAESSALTRLTTTPHRTAEFTNGGSAKVMYAPDGSWYFIVVKGVSAPVQVVWKHEGTITVLGTAMPHGDAAMLYLPKSHRMDQLALMQGSQELARAQLAFE